MTPSLLRAALTGLAALGLSLSAAAQSKTCDASLSTAAYDPALSADDAHLKCDLDWASDIRSKARKIYGAPEDSMLQIIDTASPSGAAYIYDVSPDGPYLKLDARSVPQGKGPRCQLQAIIPMDTAAEVKTLLDRASDSSVPGYGPREDVTINADGSRSVRLVFESHDIITRAETASGTREFSRHAGSDDPVSRLNNLVIGLANVSPGWVCKTS